MECLKAFSVEKFTLDGRKFHTLTKYLLRVLLTQLGLYSLYAWPLRKAKKWSTRTPFFTPHLETPKDVVTEGEKTRPRRSSTIIQNFTLIGGTSTEISVPGPKIQLQQVFDDCKISRASGNQPSLRLYKLAYSELVPKPGNREGCSRKDIQRKTTLGCMAVLTLTLICVAAAGQLVVIQ